MDSEFERLVEAETSTQVSEIPEGFSVVTQNGLLSGTEMRVVLVRGPKTIYRGYSQAEAVHLFLTFAPTAPHTASRF